jgi:hypothetical protein
MPAPVVHFEIGCRNLETARKFYGPLFGWEFEAFGNAAMVTNLGHGGDGMGIGGHINSLGHEPHNYVTVYAMVDDLAATIEKATTLGGKQIVPPTEVPGMGHFAWLADPEGNVVGLWKTMMPAK